SAETTGGRVPSSPTEPTLALPARDRERCRIGPNTDPPRERGLPIRTDRLTGEGTHMTVSGDLTTIDLADLLQNIEAHSRTGTLTLRSDESDAQLFFRGGKVVLQPRHNRP